MILFNILSPQKCFSHYCKEFEKCCFNLENIKKKFQLEKFKPFPKTVGLKTLINHPETISRFLLPFAMPIFRKAPKANKIRAELTAMMIAKGIIASFVFCMKTGFVIEISS